MTPVLLATCAAYPDGEPGGDLLIRALAERGLEGRWVCWDDPAVDWASGLVCVRSTWDYHCRPVEFLDWARSLPRVLNGSDVFTWNADKAYLVELAAAGVTVVPTVAVDGPEQLADVIAGFDEPLVKPRVGAGGHGVVVVSESTTEFGRGPWVVQPVVGSVRTEGEHSVYVLDGEVVAQARKVPAAGELRVQEEYGGRTVAVALEAEAVELARIAVGSAERILGRRLDYARVDAMRLCDGRLALSELEATEPGLYLDVLPSNASAFAALCRTRIGE